ncbi:MAG: hypothetical protein HYR63_05735 [Proteobacteria bacterium]|nr:hypothetical protein [Pseudomonadota bacterium]MBI3495801.1 hypothetical protein [Pseudomonadota bacterium]
MSGDPGNALLAIACFLAALCLALAPLALVRTLPIQDYPNHLARMHVLASLPSSAALQRFYEVNWQPVANLAMDLVVPGLARLMPLEWAGRAFIGAAFALLAGGSMLLHRALWRRSSLWPLIAFLFLYDRILFLGLLNYLFGAGLCLLAFAIWISVPETRRWALLKILISTAFGVALYFAHLFAFAVYAVLVLGYELGRIVREPNRGWAAILRSLAIAAAPGIPPLILFMLSPHGEGAWVFANPSRKLDLIFTVLDNYNRAFDVASFALLLAAFAVGCWKGLIRIAPAMIAPLAALTAAYLLMPSMMMTAANVDRRIPIVLVLALVAASEPTEAMSRAMRQLIFAGASLLFVTRMAVIIEHWRHADRIYAALSPAFELVLPGSRVAVGFPPSAAHLRTGTVPILHLPTQWVTAKDALVPTLFAAPTQQPVRLAPASQALADAVRPDFVWDSLVRGAVLSPELMAALAQFDYICLLDHDPFVLARSEGIEAIFEQPRFKLYRLTRR